MLAQRCVAIVALFSLSHAKPTAKVLQYDDVIVADRDGSIVIMKDYEYELQEARETLHRRKADFVHVAPRRETHTNQRRCDESIEYQVLSVSGYVTGTCCTSDCQLAKQGCWTYHSVPSCPAMILLFFNSCTLLDIID